MYGYVAIALLAVVACGSSLPKPVRVTIDCGSDEREFYGASGFQSKAYKPGFDINNFCNLIHNAIPKAVKNGRFVLKEPDMDEAGDTQVPMSARPPQGFIPKYIKPRLKIPRINVPKLKTLSDNPFSAPRVGTLTSYNPFRSSLEEESSAEKIEKFKKGVQKMLHVVKVLGQVDQYLSERVRIVIDKLAKTFAD